MDPSKPMNLLYLNPKKNKSVALDTIRKEEYGSTDTETLNDEKKAYFIKKFWKICINKNKSQERYWVFPSELRKGDHEKTNTEMFRKKPQFTRCISVNILAPLWMNALTIRNLG